MVQQPPGPQGGMQPPPSPPPGMPPQAPMGRPRVPLETSSLPIPDIIVAAGSLIAWIMALLSWYKAKYLSEWFGVKLTYHGGYQWLPWIIFFLLMLYAGFVILNKYMNLVELDLPNGLIYLAAGVAGLFFTFLAILIRPGGFDVSTMNWPVWIISLILSCGPLVGGLLELQRG